MSASAEIAGRVVFSELPLYSIRAELIRLNDGNKKFQKIKNLNEIPNSASIGIVNGYEYPYELMEMMSTKKSLLLLKDEATILSMLQKGRIDYGILNLDDLKTLDVVLAQAGIQNKKQFTTIYKSKLQGYVGFSLQHPLGLKLKEQFDRGYQQIIQSKEKENILKRCKKEVF